MRLSWFSPLPPARSGVADYTGDLLPALARRAEVTLWTDQDKWDAGLERHARVRRYEWQRMPWAEVQKADATIYQMGNSLAHHGAIWQVSRRLAGLVVLHDVKLQHLFSGIYREQQAEDLHGYLRQMKRFHGPVIADVIAFWAGHLTTEDMAERYPLSLLGVENALAAVVHSRQAFDVLAQAARWPVCHVPLPFAASPRRPGGPRSRAPDDAARLIIFGHNGKNRRLESVLQALAEMPERDRFRLDIYGGIWDEPLVRGWIRAQGLESQVTVHGFVSAAVLDRALASSDLAINLRFPSMGEASSSQLRIWDHALPSLVTQADWYAGLPEDAVAFVRPADEVPDIQRHLRAFLEFPARFTAMGECGRRALEARHSPDAYATALLDLARMAPRHRARAAAWDFAERLGVDMSAWVGAAATTTCFERLGEELDGLTRDSEEEKSLATAA